MPADEANTLRSIAFAYQRMEQFDKAKEYFAKALEIWERIGDLRSAAFTHVIYGVYSRKQNDFKAALEHDLRARKLWLKANDSPEQTHNRACEQVCPAGVEYGNLLEVSRAELRSAGAQHGFAHGAISFALRSLWPYPKRLAAFFWFARLFRTFRLPSILLATKIPLWFFPRVAFALALLRSSTPADLKMTKTGERPTEIQLNPGDRSVTLFTGCVMDGLFGHVNAATSRVLKANGYKIGRPSKQVCCGALHLHSGDLDGAKNLARKNIEAFEGDSSHIITNAGGCGAMLLNYAHILKDDVAYAERAKELSSRVRDIGQELNSNLIDMKRDYRCEKTTYDASCHLLHGQHASGESLRLLTSVVGENYVPLPQSDVCCGGAGIYNLLEPELSSKILKEKTANIRKTGAKVLATGNPGCQMQIGAGMSLFESIEIKLCHPIEVLDEMYKRSGLYSDSE